MIEPGYIEILAKDSNIEQIIIMVIVGIFWVIGALVSRAKKREAAKKANLLRQQQAMRNNNKTDDEGWKVLAPPPVKRQQPPIPQPRPVDAKKPSIQQFVRESHSKLIKPQPVEHLHHVKPEPLPVLHADEDLPSKHTFTDNSQPQFVSVPVSRKPRLQPEETMPAKVKKTAAEAIVEPVKVLSGLARLADPQAAKTAMVFHEILSPPKALRDEDNMWD